MFYVFIAGVCTVLAFIGAQEGDKKTTWFAASAVVLNLLAGLQPV